MKQNFVETMKVMLYVYEECKYTASVEVFENSKQVTYDNVIAFEVVTGKKAELIESNTDGSNTDDCHEYLVLYMEDGSTSTFRNSYVDLFTM